MDTIKNQFDVIIVGGGHAGTEAAHAAAKIGAKTLLLTLSIEKIGLMPCNPAIGGVGKGHIVFELGALGGLMPQLATQTYLQARMLNTRKGAAVHGLRLQIDKHKYNRLAKETLLALENLTIVEAKVEDIILADGKVVGLSATSENFGMDSTAPNGLAHHKRNNDNLTLAAHPEQSETKSQDHPLKKINYYAPSIVLTTGTFMRGLMHVGFEKKEGGRVGEQAVSGLTKFLKAHDIQMGRLKTGTPPRLKAGTIDFSILEKQDAHELNYLFEFWPHKVTNTLDCYITHTNTQTHDILKTNFSKSPIFTKQIEGIPPRYCPSIEDKISRFPDKDRHQIFVEPESTESDWIYPNGISTSMPLEVQEQYIRSIKGFENAQIVQAGYAVEYDFVFPHQLHHTLELKTIPGLYLAGQINGTTGYEEAAGQGFIAGANAALARHHKKELILNRNESYIGVMVDDLVTMSVDEPYRMFTSRAERRLILRQDNAFLRLMPKGYELGMINQAIYDAFCHERELITAAIAQLKKQFTNKPAALIELIGGITPHKQAIRDALEYGDQFSDRAIITIHAEIIYEPYIKREEKEIKKAQIYQNLEIPSHTDFSTMDGLSMQLRQKLTRHKPLNIEAASRIPGMTPAAISLLIFKIKQKESY
ncbi:MAG: tRNA uridine-5-carboxymethylaminomethyl(34) synthesis enzyme MnmG [Candidatus Babeliales bacterium]